MAHLAILIAECVPWILGTVALALDLSGRQPLGPARWVAAGMLLLATGLILDQFGRYRHWPPSQLAIADIVQLALSITGIACAVTGIAVWWRSHRVGPGKERG